MIYLFEKEVEEIIYLNLDIILVYYRELLIIFLIKEKIRGYFVYYN